MTETVAIPLGSGVFSLIDAEDEPRVSGRKWHRCGSGGRYAGCKIGGKTVLMHRLLLDATPGSEVDHRDGDGLNNRRSNIRLCTRSENNCNRRAGKLSRVGFKGIRQQGSSFEARVVLNGEEYRSGGHESAEAARSARDLMVIQLHGRFARASTPTSRL